MTTTTATLRPFSPVCWSTGDTTRFATLLPPAFDTPIGHSRVREFGAPDLHVMTLALRPYEPTAAEVTRMRRWVAECAPSIDATAVADAMSDAEIIRFVCREYVNGFSPFVIR